MSACDSGGYPYSYGYVLTDTGRCTRADFQVYGVVPNGVTIVGIFINRRLHRVAAVHNVFFYRVATTADQKVDAFVLRYQDGTRVVTAWYGWHPSKAQIAAT